MLPRSVNRSGIAFAVLALAALGRTTPYHSAEGFSIEPPPGWKVMDTDSTAAMNDAIVNQYKLKLGNNDLKFAMFDPTSKPFATNINVVVRNGFTAGDPSQSDADDFKSGLQTEYQKLGIDSKTLYAKLASFCGHDAIEAESLMSISGQQVHILQVLVAAGGKQFTITCTSLDSKFGELKPLFEQTVNSMKIDGDTGASHGPKLSEGTVSTLIGLCVGVAFGLILVYVKRR